MIQFGLVDFFLVLPAIALFVFSCVPLLIKVLRGNREPNPFAVLIYAYMGIITAVGLMLPAWGAERLAFSGALVFDGLSVMTSVVVLGVTGVAVTYLKDSAAINPKQFTEVIFLTLNCTLGMLTMLWSNDLIVTFVGLELFSLCLYMLIATSLEGKLSKEAAFKYFILGSFASAILLYGISFVFGAVGSTQLPEVAGAMGSLLATNRMFIVGFVLLLLGLCFKISVFPFHSWAPDVYQGSPTALTAYMATGVKAVTLAFFLRLMASQAFSVERFWPFVDALQWLAVFTILVGNVGALRQASLKRMLAYSSIAHSGYALIGIIAAGMGGASMVGASGVMYYVIAYSIMTAGAFGVIHLLESHAETDILVEDVKGMAMRRPWLAMSLSVLLLSLAGIPPTLGFFGKLFLFSAAVKQGLVWLVVWAVIGSIVSVYYYLRPILAMYMEESDIEPSRHELRPMSYFTVTSLALLVILFGIASERFYALVIRSLEVPG